MQSPKTWATGFCIPSHVDLQVRTQHVDPLMPCWRPAQLVQHTSAVEEEPAVHPEPIDNPGCEKMGKLGEVNTSQEIWNQTDRKLENATKTPQIGETTSGRSGWVTATKIARAYGEIGIQTRLKFDEFVVP